MPNLLRKFRKFFSHPLADQFLLVKTFAVISLIRVSLKLFSFEKFRRIFGKIITTPLETNYSSETIKHFVWAITSVSPIVSAVCLPQALALKYFLRKDKAVKLLIGTSLTKGFAAHAWVEKENQMLIGELPDSDFQTLWTWE